MEWRGSRSLRDTSLPVGILPFYSSIDKYFFTLQEAKTSANKILYSRGGYGGGGFGGGGGGGYGGGGGGGGDRMSHLGAGLQRQEWGMYFLYVLTVFLVPFFFFFFQFSLFS